MSIRIPAYLALCVVMLSAVACEQAAPAEAKKEKTWTWQELQDHLANKGWKTSRGQGNHGMWFFPGDGKPLARDVVTIADETWKTQVSGDAGRWFLAKDAGTPVAAKKEAARINDTDQSDVIAWNKFIFFSPKEARVKLKAILP